MRLNKFNERYAHDHEELASLLEPVGVSEVYVGEVRDANVLTEEMAYAEVVRNDSGETVCHVEAPSASQVRSILALVGVEVQS